MKKCIAIVLALAFMFSLFQVTCFADEAVAGTNGVVQEITVNSNGEKTYTDFLEANKNVKDATENIVISADSYVSSDAAIEKLASFEDENKVVKENVIKWTGEKGSATYTFSVPADGMYEIHLSYCPIKGRGLPLRFGFLIDGKTPYDALKAVNFARTFIDEKPDGIEDSNGNVYASEQIEKLIYKTTKAMETSGQFVSPMKIALSAGEHTITLNATSGEFYLESIILAAPEQVKSYAEVKKEYEAAGYKYYSGNDITIEGERANYKSTASMNPLIDNSDPSVKGLRGDAEAFKSIVNYVGGTGWQKPNDTLYWTVEVPEDGLYKVAFRFRQNVVINGNSYRSLMVDGKSPFAEAAKVPFYYNGNWQFSELQADGETALIYLTKGTHELSMAVTLADFGAVSRAINDVTYDIGNLYLKIRMITGEKVDTGRSYEFFRNVPQWDETLLKNIEALGKVREQIVEITQETSGTYIATIDNMIRVLQDMYDNPYTAQKYINTYYDNYTSLCALVTDVAKLPLDLDQIILGSPEKEGYDFEMAGWWEKTKYSFERFLVSFMDDYKYKTMNVDGKTTLTLWVTWGRDQTQILTSLVKDTFEAEHPDITVNIQIVGATLIQAILAGSGPDLLIGQIRTEPVNYGMRGALLPLSEEFDDYEEVVKRFQKGADKPYKLNGVSYGIPDTQNFSIMFYRTDILEQMGVTKAPKTWDEFKELAALLQRQNLAAGLPTGATTVNTYATRLMQKNLPVYTENQRTSFLSGEAVQTFVEWTEYYTDLGFLKAYDFYNRFRAGTIPIGVADYTQYTLFSQAAPEIVGKWDIAVMPGTKNADGTVNHTQADTGTACVIPKITKHKEEAWEFLKWWTDANAQYRYSVMLEAILGETGRRATANMEAFRMLSWESDHLDVLEEAWSWVYGLEEVPGGYYVDRSVMQAFQNVVNISKNPKDMIFKWAKIADQEIDRKRGEYNLD